MKEYKAEQESKRQNMKKHIAEQKRQISDKEAIIKTKNS